MRGSGRKEGKEETYVQKSPSVLPGEPAPYDFGLLWWCMVMVITMQMRRRGRRRRRRILHDDLMSRRERPTHAIAMRIHIRRYERIGQSEEGRRNRRSRRRAARRRGAVHKVPSTVQEWVQPVLSIIHIKNPKPNPRIGKVSPDSELNRRQPLIRQRIRMRNNREHIDTCGKTANGRYLCQWEGGPAEDGVGRYGRL